MMKIVILFLSCILSWCHGSKLENWRDPSIDGSIQPDALQSASRNPKLFFGVSSIKLPLDLSVHYRSLKEIYQDLTLADD